MNVTASARQVTDYTFRLTDQDLERYLADPQAWADEVRAQLGKPAAGQAKAVRKGAAGKKAQGGRRAAGLARGGVKGRSAKKLKPKATLECPACKKPFKSPKRLDNHLEKAHPDYERKETYSP